MELIIDVFTPFLIASAWKLSFKGGAQYGYLWVFSFHVYSVSGDFGMGMTAHCELNALHSAYFFEEN